MTIVQFTGTVPCIVDDSPDFMHGDWTVLSKSGEGKYTVGALIEGNRVETVVSKTVLDKALELARRGGGEPQAPRRDDPGRRHVRCGRLPARAEGHQGALAAWPTRLCAPCFGKHA